MLSLYAAVAERSFRRYSTYTAATLAGIFTNSVFGLIYSFAYIALWDKAPDAGGYDSIDAVTFVWLGQALLMTVALWGGGTTDDLAERIRTGDVAIDLYRPTGLVGWYLAGDLGRASYHLVTRGLGPTFIGLIFFHIRLPTEPAGRRGVRGQPGAGRRGQLRAALHRRLVGVLAARRERGALPQRRLRDLLQRDDAAARALPRLARHARPGAAVVGDHPGARTTSGSGQYDGWALLGALGFQVLWVVLLLGLCEGVLRAATRKVVVQGG